MSGVVGISRVGLRCRSVVAEPAGPAVGGSECVTVRPHTGRLGGSHHRTDCASWKVMWTWGGIVYALPSPHHRLNPSSPLQHLPQHFVQLTFSAHPTLSLASRHCSTLVYLRGSPRSAPLLNSPSFSFSFLYSQCPPPLLPPALYHAQARAVPHLRSASPPPPPHPPPHPLPRPPRPPAHRRRLPLAPRHRRARHPLPPRPLPSALHPAGRRRLHRPHLPALHRRAPLLHPPTLHHPHPPPPPPPPHPPPPLPPLPHHHPPRHRHRHRLHLPPTPPPPHAPPPPPSPSATGWAPPTTDSGS